MSTVVYACPGGGYLTQEVESMGATGPIPKRSEERRRRNKVDTTQVEIVGTVEVPEPDPDWHPAAARWYESLQLSGQHKFYEPSDWAAAQLLAHELTRMLKARASATMFAAVWAAMGDLLTTEGERRRVRMEIVRRPEPVEAPAGVTRLDDYRDL